MMKRFSIPVTELDKSLTEGTGEFSAFLHEGEVLPAVIVLSGGGYYMQSQAEGVPVAEAFYRSGYQAFYLNYSLLPCRFPQQLLEAAAAITYLRAHHKELGVDPNRIVLCGFSAGAHLAASLSNLYAHEIVTEQFPNARPTAAILSYAVTSGEIDDCVQMYQNLCGRENYPEIVSPDKTVHRNTPPTFLWHTADDPMVDVRHSLSYAALLRENGVPFELHVFPDGPHAMSLCIPETAYSSAHVNPHAAQWFPLALNWLKKVLS